MFLAKKFLSLFSDFVNCKFNNVLTIVFVAIKVPKLQNIYEWNVLVLNRIQVSLNFLSVQNKTPNKRIRGIHLNVL